MPRNTCKIVRQSPQIRHRADQLQTRRRGLLCVPPPPGRRAALTSREACSSETRGTEGSRQPSGILAAFGYQSPWIVALRPGCHRWSLLEAQVRRARRGTSKPTGQQPAFRDLSEDGGNYRKSADPAAHEAAAEPSGAAGRGVSSTWRDLKILG